jgi:hypothetical protein
MPRPGSTIGNPRNTASQRHGKAFLQIKNQIQLLARTRSSRIFYENFQALFQDGESSFELLHTRMMIQIEQAVDHGFRNAEVGLQLSIAYSRGEKRGVELRLHASQGRQFDQAKLPAASVLIVSSILSRLDVRVYLLSVLQS